MNAVLAQMLLDTVGYCDGYGATINVSAPLMLPRGSTLVRCNVVAASGVPYAIRAGDGSAPTGEIRVADVRCVGAGIDMNWCGNYHLDRVSVENAPGVGVRVNRGYEANLTNCRVYDCGGTAFLIEGEGNDQFLTRCRAVRCDVGVEVKRTSALYLDSVSASFCGTGLKIGYAGETCEFVFSSKCAYDEGSGHGMRLGSGVRSFYSSEDWASSNVMSGVIVEGASDASFSQLRCYNNQMHGAHLVSGSDLALIGGCFSGNGGVNPPNYHGVVVANVNGVRIVGCRSGAVAQFSAVQGYGLFISSPFAENVIIEACDFRSNLTGDTILQGSYKAGGNYP